MPVHVVQDREQQQHLVGVPAAAARRPGGRRAPRRSTQTTSLTIMISDLEPEPAPVRPRLAERRAHRLRARRSSAHHLDPPLAGAEDGAAHPDEHHEPTRLHASGRISTCPRPAAPARRPSPRTAAPGPSSASGARQELEREQHPAQQEHELLVQEPRRARVPQPERHAREGVLGGQVAGRVPGTAAGTASAGRGGARRRAHVQPRDHGRRPRVRTRAAPPPRRAPPPCAARPPRPAAASRSRSRRTRCPSRSSRSCAAWSRSPRPRPPSHTRAGAPVG